MSDDAKREMELSFSRGFSPGWMRGNDHKRLVPGLQSAKRGIELGSVLDIDAPCVKLLLQAPVALGDGLAICRSGGSEDQGGRIYSLYDEQQRAWKTLSKGQVAWIGFGRGEVDWDQVRPGAVVFKNDDPQLNRRLRQSYSSADPQRRRPMDMQVVAETGLPLRLVGLIADANIRAIATGTQPLEEATKHPADESMLREKLGRLGGTPFYLRELEATIGGDPMVPMAQLNGLRRELVEALLEQLNESPSRQVDIAAGRSLLNPIGSPLSRESQADPSRLGVLCRTMEQIESACAAGAALVYADFHDIRRYRDAVQCARQQNVPIALASVRVQKPGETGLLKSIAKHQPDFVLARNLAAIAYYREAGIPTIADFSLNVANHRSAEWLRGLGPQRITASYDLNRDQLVDLVAASDATWMEVVIHQHMPMFHMEHCVFCSVLSPGTNKTNCGRPCDRHLVKLRDRVGAEHPLEADVACRNTLYNATAQSGAEVVDQLQRMGVNWFRIELLEQNATEAATTIAVYRRLLRGKATAQEVWRTLKATNRVGVTRGTLESKRNPLAIL